MNKKNKSTKAAQRNAEKAAKAAERRAADLAANAAEDAENAAGAVKDAAEGAVESAKDAAEGAVESVKDAAEGAVESAKDAAEGAVESAKDAAEGTVESVKDAAEGAVESAKDAAEEAVESVKDAAENVADKAEDAVESVKETAEKAADKVKSTAKKAEKKAESAVKDVRKTASNAGTKTAAAAQNAVKPLNVKKSKKTAASAPVFPDVKVYDFCSKKKMILGILIGVLAALLLGIIIRGVHLAIEFKGGTLLSYTYAGDIDTNVVQDTVRGVVPDTSVVARVGESLSSGGKELTVSFTAKEGLSVDKQHEITENLKNAFPNANMELTDSNDVSPSSGREFLLKCLIAVIFAAFVVVVYIAIRFRRIGGWSAGVCSVFALVHDILVALAVTILFGFEFNSNIVAVILTILGYSINNTIVIYDRIRENRSLMPNASLNELINTGCSQSLTRSIRTSVTTIGTMLIVSIVVLVSGYNSLLSFSVPLMFGLISGTYSSLFVAPVTWSWWKNKEKNKK